MLPRPLELQAKKRGRPRLAKKSRGDTVTHHPTKRIFEGEEGLVNYLEGGDVGGEAVDAEHHLPGAAALGPPGAASELAVVLPDPPPRVHREPATRPPGARSKDEIFD